MEDHSDHFIREDTVANLIDVQRFFQDIIAQAESLEDRKCFEIISAGLRKDNTVIAKVMVCGRRYYASKKGRVFTIISCMFALAIFMA